MNTATVTQSRASLLHPSSSCCHTHTRTTRIRPPGNIEFQANILFTSPHIFLALHGDAVYETHKFRCFHKCCPRSWPSPGWFGRNKGRIRQLTGRGHWGSGGRSSAIKYTRVPPWEDSPQYRRLILSLVLLRQERNASSQAISQSRFSLSPVFWCLLSFPCCVFAACQSRLCSECFYEWGLKESVFICFVWMNWRINNEGV